MKVDIIGEWSVDKLTILRFYAERYSLILNHQTFRGAGAGGARGGYSCPGDAPRSPPRYPRPLATRS